MIAVCLFLLALPLISGQAIGKGSCPLPPVQPNFNLNAYLGMWYEIARIPSPISDGLCVTAEYKTGKGNTFTAEHGQLINGNLSFKTGKVRVMKPGEEAKLEIQFSKDEAFRPYWVLETDYKTYAIVYTCENHYDTHSQYAWVVARKPNLDAKTLGDAKRVLMKQGIYANMLEVTDQSCYTRTPGKN